MRCIVHVKDNCLLYTDRFFIMFLKLCHFLPLKLLLTSMINYLFIPFMYSHCSFPYNENMQLSSSILVSRRYYCRFYFIFLIGCCWIFNCTLWISMLKQNLNHLKYTYNEYLRFFYSKIVQSITIIYYLIQVILWW